MSKNKKPEYYVVRIDKELGWVRYKRDAFVDEFVPAYMRSDCATFSKKRAEQIIARLNTKMPSGWEKRIEYGMEAVE